MPDPNEYIRARLRQAREEAGLSQREVAEQFGAAQVTISDLERGRTNVSAGDLVRLAAILGKSVLYFLPGVQSSDLSDREQTLVALFRELDDQWQASVLDIVRGQAQLYTQTKAIESMPEDQQEQAAYDLAVAVLQAFGAKLTLGEDGRPQLDGGQVAALLEGRDEKDRQIIEELVRRLMQQGQ